MLRFVLFLSLPLWMKAFQPTPKTHIKDLRCFKQTQRRSLRLLKLHLARKDVGSPKRKKLSDKPFQPKPKRPRNSSRSPNSDRSSLIFEMGSQGNWRGILKLYSNSRNVFNIIDFSTAMSQIAKNRPPRQHYHLLDGLVDHMADYIEKTPLITRNYSNIVHSITKLDLQTTSSQQIIARLQDVAFVTEFLQHCNSIDMANIVWSLAKREHMAEFRVVMDKASHSNFEALFQAKSPQSAANVAWGCGTMGYERPDLFSMIEQNAAWIVTEGRPQAVANTAGACGKLGYHAPKLFAAIEDRSQWLVANGNTQEVANTAYACAKVGYYAPQLFAAIEDRSRWLVMTGTPQAVANTAWACLTLGHEAPKLFELVVENIDRLSAGSEKKYFQSIMALADESLGISNPFKQSS